MLILQLFLQFISLTVWLLIIPFLIGLLPARLMPKGRRTPGVIFLSGFIIFLAIFELVGIIVVLNTNHDGMASLLRFFTPIIIALAALSLGMEIVLPSIRPRFRLVLPTTWEEKIVWLLFFLLLGFQLFMAFTRASIDGDDAFFVVQSLIANERGFLYRIEPYTGDSTALNMRNALAVFPLWIALLAEKTRIHSTILAHSIIPLFLLPLTYLLYFQIGKSLFTTPVIFSKKGESVAQEFRKESLPIFMVMIALIQMFGNVSIFTNETFLMTRTWQGKSLAANFIIPAVFWLFLVISEITSARDGAEEMNIEQKAKEKSNDFAYWLVLGTLTWTAGISSSLAVFLALLLAVVIGLYLAVYRRSLKFFLKTIIACVPGMIYIGLYSFLS